MLWNKDIGNVSILSLDNGCCVLRIQFKVYGNLMKLIHLNVEGSLLDVGERPSLLNYNPLDDFEAIAVESHFHSFARTDLEEQKEAKEEIEKRLGKEVEDAFIKECMEDLIEVVLPISTKKGRSVHDIIFEALDIGLEQMDKEVENG
ncbi:MAG: hypothetical protein JNL36_07775 [Candidatus Kapabacteria bacterium]|nr:hypothetical protein [Candidatus Kapabacteria bacterium]